MSELAVESVKHPPQFFSLPGNHSCYQSIKWWVVVRLSLNSQIQWEYYTLCKECQIHIRLFMKCSFCAVLTSLTMFVWLVIHKFDNRFFAPEFYV